MPVLCVALENARDYRDYRVQRRHLHSPQVRLMAQGVDWAAVPEVLRQAADQIWMQPPAAGQPDGFLWRAGERWLEGTAADVRGRFRQPGQRVFVPVHADAGDGLDMIWLEPRVHTEPGAGGRREDVIDPRIRIGARLTAAGPAGVAECAASAGEEAWKQLAGAAYGRDLRGLADFARRLDLHPALHALGLRNLAVELLRRQELDETELLVRQAAALHPEYRELDYLTARLRLAQGRMKECVEALQRATRAHDAGAPRYYVGSGGEAGYRAHALLAVLAEGTGHQAVALHHFLTGVRARPAHAASVAGILRQRVPAAMLPAVQWELSGLGRREPSYRPAVFDFLLLHRAFAEAERLTRVWPLEGDEEGLYRRRLAAHVALRGPGPRAAGGRRGVMLEGPFLIHASTAAINRRLAAGLGEAFEVGLDPTVAGEVRESEMAEPAGWSDGMRQLPRRLDLTIRHGWPPNFATPATGRLALVLPWEFGAVPRAWVAQAANVDEFWVPSAFVGEVLTRAGVDPGKIAVIPNGVDLDAFAPRGDGERPRGARQFEFLFVGGAIRRKGLDVLLRAWREAFTAGDDVCLVIKSLGGKSYYRHLRLDDEIAALARDPGAAPVIHVEEEWREERMANLYRGCDALVLPYRGEGFGMPLAEAMACGKPVIATGRGPAAEFCPAEASWLMEAREAEVPERERPAEAMSGPFTWFEPSQTALIAALRQAASDRDGCAERGRSAARAIRATHGWERILEQYRERAARLVERA